MAEVLLLNSNNDNLEQATKIINQRFNLVFIVVGTLCYNVLVNELEDLFAESREFTLKVDMVTVLSDVIHCILAWFDVATIDEIMLKDLGNNQVQDFYKLGVHVGFLLSTIERDVEILKGSHSVHHYSWVWVPLNGWLEPVVEVGKALFVLE